MADSDMDKISSLPESLKKLAKDYHDFKKNKKSLGFNVFALTSERYYLENYHSDILKAFLDPHEKHGEGNLFLEQFLKLLGVKFEPYKDATVTREKHHIDILIENKSSERAIIIENKINNAPDTNNQIPKYYEKLKNDYKVEKIIYIPLDRDKKPDRSTWETSFEDEIEKHLVIMPAFLGKDDISLSRWIKKCITKSKNYDNKLILKQYLKIIEFLNGDKHMEDKFIESFCGNLDAENLRTALEIQDMLKKLPNHLASRIKRKYNENSNKHPFKNVKIWNNGTIFSGYEFDNHNFKLEVYCDINKYVIVFKESKNDNTYDIKQKFSGINSLSGFDISGPKSSISKDFCTIEGKSLSEFEECLCEIIDDLLKNLSDLQNNQQPSVTAK